MTTITRTAPGKPNDRRPPRIPSAGNEPDVPDLVGSISFELNSTAAEFLALEMKADAPDGFYRYPDNSISTETVVGVTDNGEYYLRIPRGKICQIDFNLGGNLTWEYVTDGGVTLASKDHVQRYWLVGSTNAKRRTLLVVPSGKRPVMKVDDRGQNDEKFNLEVSIAQGPTSSIPLIIEIDPITKNPPPSDGRTVETDTFGKLL